MTKSITQSDLLTEVTIDERRIEALERKIFLSDGNDWLYAGYDPLLTGPFVTYSRGNSDGWFPDNGLSVRVSNDGKRVQWSGELNSAWNDPVFPDAQVLFATGAIPETFRPAKRTRIVLSTSTELSNVEMKLVDGWVNQDGSMYLNLNQDIPAEVGGRGLILAGVSYRTDRV